MALYAKDASGKRVKVAGGGGGSGGGGGTAGVSSFNGRTGAVTPQTGDYTASQVGAVPTTRTINFMPLSGDIMLSASDVGAVPAGQGGVGQSDGGGEIFNAYTGEGNKNTATGTYSHAEGKATKALGVWSHTEGGETTAYGWACHAEGFQTIAGYAEQSAMGAHAEGANTTASAGSAHAEGDTTTASGQGSHAEGYKTTASERYAHAEGQETTASGPYTHSEGYKSVASAESAHAEGTSTTAGGRYSHTEGEGTSTGENAWGAHAEGSYTVASGLAAHAEGADTQAKERTSHAAGSYTIAAAENQYVIGTNNVESTSTNDIFIIGGGSGFGTTRKNAFRVQKSGATFGGNYNSSGADYAELFEWVDGNPEGEDRAGLFVTLEGEHIRIASPEDGYILGIVSASPSVVGDVYDDQWQGMFVRDVFGRIVYEMQDFPARTVERSGPDGQMETVELTPAHSEMAPKINPDYDNIVKYQPRTQRPEWDAVGLMGKLVAVDDGTCRPNGWAAVGPGGKATASAERTKYRVMARLDDTHIKIMIL